MGLSWSNWCWQFRVASFVAMCAVYAASGDFTKAQIAPDSTLGAESSLITPNVSIEGLPADRVDGGAIRGTSLFHSFQQFNVGDGQRVFFANPAGIENIFSRVTGTNPSTILGTLGVNGGANLFLLNPNGIIFGRNASLNTGGSFVATTANAIGFSNQGFFSATNPNTAPMLTVNPSALLFNQIAAASIQNNSVAPAGRTPTGSLASGLRVPDGRSLLLLGGNVSINGGRIGAYGGRVEFGGLATPGTVGLGVDGNNFTASFPDNVTRADVSLINAARVDVAAAGGGSIAVNARNLDILGSTLSAGIGQGLGSVGTVAGDITLNATGEIKVAGGSNVVNLVGLGSKGNGGNITIDSGSFSSGNGALVTASTFGQGNTGNVTIHAKDAFSLPGNAYIFSTVEAGGVGKGGNIDINAASFSLADDAQLATITRGASNTQPAGRGDAGNVNVTVTGAVWLRDGASLAASTLGQGNTGNVIVHAKDAVSLTDNATILSTVGAGGVGKGGNIDINTASFSLADGAQLQTSTRGASNTQPAGRGDSGNINVTVTGAINIAGEKNGFFSGIFSQMLREAVGNGGNITIDSGSFSLRDGTLSASTSGQGNAGNVIVHAKDSVSLTDNATILSTVEEGGVGKGGNIDINAASFLLTDGAQLLTLNRGAFNTQSAGRGDAGNVNVTVTGAVNIAGEKNGLASGIFSRMETGTVGNGGNINIDSGSFSLRNGTLSASTFGQGNAGNVTLHAKDSVSLTDNAGILTTVEAGGVGKGGDIDINAALFSLADGAQLVTIIGGASNTQPAGRGDAGNVNVTVTGAVNIAGEKNGFFSGIFSFMQTGTVGNGGNITIDSGSFLLRDGALSASTLGQGNAGTIKVNAADFVIISGKNSNINSGLFVNSLSPTGTAGDIIVASPRVTLDNGGIINAQSQLGNGGDIILNVGDLLLLRRGAQISTTAGTAQAGGNGGNVTINAPSGLIVAVANENNDITANAYQGRGGNINITAQGIFGLEFRNDLTPLSDITVSSEFGLAGVFEIDILDVDPGQGLTELPTEVVDVSSLIGQDFCRVVGKDSEFVVTGRGGLPTSPNETLRANAPWEDLRLAEDSQPTALKLPSAARSEQPKTKHNQPGRIVEAQGWITSSNGNVLLTAKPVAVTPQGLWLHPLDCQLWKQSSRS